MSKKLLQSLSGNKAADILSSLVAIFIGLFVGFLILLASNPANAVAGMKEILISGFADKKSMGQVLYFATPVIMTGLSVGFASRTGLFNIGASGQFIIGAYAAIFVGVKCVFLGPMHWVVALLAAVIAGAIWGSIPGLLKAYRNVNEVISCIMMNYVGMYFVNFLISKTVFDSLKNQSARPKASANLPKMGFDLIFRDGNNVSSVNSGIFIAILIAICLYIILQKTSFGYELKACGFGRDAAKYAGINEKRSIVMSMLIAGAAAGLGGALLYLAGSGKGIDVVDVLAAEGFNGIPVALLGLNNPIGIVFSGLFIAYIGVGGFNMQLHDFAPQIIDIIISVIIYFSAFALLIKGLLQTLSKRESVKNNANKKEIEEGAQ